MDWTVAAPIFILFIIAVIGYIIAVYANSWYKDLQKPPLSNIWIFYIFWAVSFIILAAAWTWFNWDWQTTTTYDNYSNVNIVLSCFSIGIFIWFVLYFGGAAFITALIFTLLLMGLLMAAVVLIVDNEISFGLLAGYFLWLLYIFYLNMGILLDNNFEEIREKIIERDFCN